LMCRLIVVFRHEGLLTIRIHMHGHLFVSARENRLYYT
jgi:hypothetical protein